MLASSSFRGSGVSTLYTGRIRDIDEDSDDSADFTAVANWKGDVNGGKATHSGGKGKAVRDGHALQAEGESMLIQQPAMNIPSASNKLSFNEWALTTFVLLNMMGGAMGQRWYPYVLMLTAMQCTQHAKGDPMKQFLCFV